MKWVYNFLGSIKWVYTYLLGQSSGYVHTSWVNHVVYYSTLHAWGDEWSNHVDKIFVGEGILSSVDIFKIHTISSLADHAQK